MPPDAIRKFAAAFAALPSIGPRQATRLAFYLVTRGRAAIADLEEALRGLRELAPCRRCFKTSRASAHGLCDICANPERAAHLVAIVEKETDLLSLERTKKFSGRYLVLGEIGKDGMLTPAQKLRLEQLKADITNDFKGTASEIIIALNPTTYGDLDAALIIQELKPFAQRITRLGRGLPTGGEIEFADEETLGGALEHRS